MNYKDVFWLAFTDLGEKRIRTALTVIMVVIGVASIIALISQTAGISASVSSALSSLGPTSIIITPAPGTVFTYADTSLLGSLPNASAVIPLVTGSVNIYTDGQNVSADLIGVAAGNADQLIGNLTFIQGQLYTNGVNPETVIGYSVAYPGTSGTQYAFVGQPITIKTEKGGTYTVPVVGMLKKYGTSFLVSPDTSVFMPLQAAESILQRQSFTEIIVKANSTAATGALATQIGDIYGNNARVISTQQLTQEVEQVIGSIGLLLGVIAGISLVVAAIGIMNIMLISVYERTHEIGIFKSLGFRNRDVLTLFLMQAIIIGFLGGVIGVVFGIGGSYGLSAVLSAAGSGPAASNGTAGSGGSGGGARFGGGRATTFGGSSGSPSSSSISYTPVVSGLTIVEAMLVAVVVSILAGVYPAWRASRLEPIDALRAL
jgi:ABC-type antimicrobial peptide transport system permease subunit